MGTYLVRCRTGSWNKPQPRPRQCPLATRDQMSVILSSISFSSPRTYPIADGTTGVDAGILRCEVGLDLRRGHGLNGGLDHGLDVGDRHRQGGGGGQSREEQRFELAFILIICSSPRIRAVLTMVTAWDQRLKMLLSEAGLTAADACLCGDGVTVERSWRACPDMIDMNRPNTSLYLCCLVLQGRK